LKGYDWGRPGVSVNGVYVVDVVPSVWLSPNARILVIPSLGGGVGVGVGVGAGSGGGVTGPGPIGGPLLPQAVVSTPSKSPATRVRRVIEGAAHKNSTAGTLAAGHFDGAASAPSSWVQNSRSALSISASVSPRRILSAMVSPCPMEWSMLLYQKRPQRPARRRLG
jgi:hypothetical protein